ncbi:hypothetical protein [Delftia deserti]|uniref:Uncharacterized protein n=1 Tax=Delftia deserti TaxID=1651218 RepID=A0ABW5F0Y7_9BURK
MATTDRDTLNAIMTVIQRHMPPDGPSDKESLSEIIVLMDSWIGPGDHDFDILYRAFQLMPAEIPLRMKRQISVNCGWSGSLVSRAYAEIRAALTENTTPR